MLKIDTDSIDCDIVAKQILPKVEAGLDVRNMCFESGGCTEIVEIIRKAQKLGYAAYRTDLWQVQYGHLGEFPIVYPHSVPDYATEVYDLRFNRYLWRFK